MAGQLRVFETLLIAYFLTDDCLKIKPRKYKVGSIAMGAFSRLPSLRYALKSLILTCGILRAGVLTAEDTFASEHGHFETFV